jgi:hypothetical protein
MKSFIPLLLAIVALSAFGGNWAAGQPRTELRRGEVGRYELVAVGDSRIYLIDTATGQCWSRRGDEEWQDAGNPARRLPGGGERRRERDPGEVSLKLPSDSVELSIVQREERSIPGSDGSVRVRLGDITDGQAFLTVVTTDDEPLLERTSVRPDDSVRFSVGNKHYVVHVRELRNVLIGDDFATLVISEADGKESPEKERPRREAK